jgi:uncharacterized protein (UPF0335 family)
MPRKPAKEKQEAKIIHIPTNGYQPAILQNYVDRIERLYADIDAVMLKARKNCTPFRDDIKEVINEAAEKHSIPKRELRAVISKRRKLQQAEKVTDALNAEQKETFEQLCHALGMLKDTPLGQAALNS